MKRTYKIMHLPKPITSDNYGQITATAELFLNRYGADGYRLVRVESVADVMAWVMERVDGQESSEK